MDEVKTPQGTILLWLTRIVPFLLPALLLASTLFTLLSPLPLFFLSIRNKPGQAFATLLINTLIVYGAGHDPSIAILALVFWFAVGIFFPFLILRTRKIPESFLLTLGYLLSMIFVILFYLSAREGLGMVEYVRRLVIQVMDVWVAIPDSPFKAFVDEEGRDALNKLAITEAPSLLIVSLILSIWLNLLFSARALGELAPRTFWESFKVPEFLIWPTLVFAGLVIWSDHAFYFAALFALKGLLAFYGFQGLSVMSQLLSRYKIFGFARTVTFSVAIFIATPLVLALGFFDLWFDFRSKFGQS
jgi:hypothetical protein